MKLKFRMNVRLLLGLALVLVTTFVAAPEAWASASRCASHALPASCVDVLGSSLMVSAVRGGVKLGPRQYVNGHYEIWTTSKKNHFHYNTGAVSYYNASWWHSQQYWGPWKQMGYNLDNGANICAQFWNKKGNGWESRGTVCVTVKK